MFYLPPSFFLTTIISPCSTAAVPGWTTELPSTALRQHSMHYRSVDEREYHDAVSQGEGLWAGPPSQEGLPYGGGEGGEGTGHEQGAGAGAGQGQATQQAQQEQQGQGAPKGLPQLPPKPAGRGAGAKAPGAGEWASVGGRVRVCGVLRAQAVFGGGAKEADVGCG